MEKIGIVGGVGPEASNRFCEMLIKNKKAENDQEHIPFIHFCNPQIPDRTDFIIGEGKDPTEELIETCNVLEKAGADFLVIPCNTAHYFLPKIQENVNIPIVDMTKILIKNVVKSQPEIKKIGILATTGSIKSGIYQNYFKKVGIETIIPSEINQKEVVMEAIYGKNGIKAGNKTDSKIKLISAANKLISQGAEALILGCTEIPLVLEQKDFKIKLYDPMDITSKEIINYIEKQTEKEEVITVKYTLEKIKTNFQTNEITHEKKVVTIIN